MKEVFTSVTPPPQFSEPISYHIKFEDLNKPVDLYLWAHEFNKAMAQEFVKSLLNKSNESEKHGQEVEK